MLRRSAVCLIAFCGLAACTTTVPMQNAAAPMNPMVGGAPMYPDKDIVENAVNSKDHTTLVAAVQAAGLVDTLKSPGPFTVFAPTNAAFDALPSGVVSSLMAPANKAKLTSVLTYHVVAGRLDSRAIAALIAQGGGRTTLTTVQGATITILPGTNGGLTILDSRGRTTSVTIADVYQKNGVIHVINQVLLPPGA